MNKSDLIYYRLVRDTDMPFIMATWLKGLIGGNDYYRMIHRESFMTNYGPFIQRRMATKGVLTMVACLKENEDIILGYSVTEKRGDSNIVHWVYVKPDWRRIGIGKEILPKKIDFATSMTKLAKKLKPKGLIFDPFL